ncbi:MAG: TIGR01777 family oxidoreductase [Planctomycetota bacterium]
MEVFVTGGTGLVGRRLIPLLLESGHRPVLLTRDPSRIAKEIRDRVRILEGDPCVLGSWQDAIDGTDAVIHLAGENIASRRWNPSFKQRLRSSRIQSTRNVVDVISRCKRPPGQFVGASAIGWYGDRGDQWVDENSSCGDDYLAHLCRDWEAASQHLDGSSTIRTVIRLGIVLDPAGGALASLMNPIRWGIGGPMAGGRFFMSWIHQNDLCRMMLWCINQRVSGLVNAVSPNPATNSEFVSALAKLMNRWAFLPVPYLPLRLMIGEMARFICSSQRVKPRKAIESGFEFGFPTLPEALKDLLNNR